MSLVCVHENIEGLQGTSGEKLTASPRFMHISGLPRAVSSLASDQMTNTGNRPGPLMGAAILLTIRK